MKRENKKVSFAAAHNAPILIRKNIVIEFEADKMPIGKGGEGRITLNSRLSTLNREIFFIFIPMDIRINSVEQKKKNSSINK